MRLNLFIPYRPKAKHSRLRRLMGPTPFRRIVQTLCLVLLGVLLAWVARPVGGPDYAQTWTAREFMDAEFFLRLDPLASISAAIAGRAWNPALVWTAGILAICLIFPRGFCGYVCPLGTLNDVFDWLVGRRIKRLHIKRRGWLVNLRYYLLACILASALLGVVTSGFLAAIPLLTRGLVSILAPLQLGLTTGWENVPPISATQIASVALTAAVIALGLLGRRFWCGCLCPTGAIFSLAASLRLTKRTVSDACARCAQCVKACSFGAIKSDFAPDPTTCASCQDCAGACPVETINFVPRWQKHVSGPADIIETVSLTRRSMLAGMAGAIAVGAGISKLFAAGRDPAPASLPVRPPGSRSEQAFLAACVSCGECIKVCPVGALQPLGLQQGLEGLWTPHIAADWAGCDPNCNICTQVCPTGAIRQLTLPEKHAFHLGLAAVDENTCLPYTGKEQCGKCVPVCQNAGHNALEYMLVGVEVDDEGMPVEDTGYLAPVVLEDKCVGCGLCQATCHSLNVRKQQLLTAAAITIHPVATPGN